MEGYGIVPATGLEPQPMLPAARQPPDGWTLWWRPVYGQEYWARQNRQLFDIDSMPALLEEAVPLIRGVKTMRVAAFAAEENPEDPEAPLIVERWPEYESTTTAQLPGYMELEIETTSGSFASWVLELGWSIAEETLTDDPADGSDGGTNENGTPPTNDGGAAPGTTIPQPDAGGILGDRT